MPSMYPLEAIASRVTHRLALSFHRVSPCFRSAPSTTWEIGLPLVSKPSDHGPCSLSLVFARVGSYPCPTGLALCGRGSEFLHRPNRNEGWGLIPPLYACLGVLHAWKRHSAILRGLRVGCVHGLVHLWLCGIPCSFWRNGLGLRIC